MHFNILYSVYRIFNDVICRYIDRYIFIQIFIRYKQCQQMCCALFYFIIFSKSFLLNVFIHFLPSLNKVLIINNWGMRVIGVCWLLGYAGYSKVASRN